MQEPTESDKMLMEGYVSDDCFWIWRGQVYAREWLAKNPSATKERFEYVASQVLRYKIDNEPTRKLCLRGWLSVYEEKQKGQ